MNVWRQSLAAITVAAMALPPPGAAANEDELRLVLKPKSSWVLDYADENCGLRRMFGNGQTELLFELNATVPGHTYRVLLASDQLKLRRVNLHMGYQPGPEPVEHKDASTITMEDGRRGYLSEMTVLAPSEIETAVSAYMPGKSYRDYWLETIEAREKEIAGLDVDKGFNRDFYLELDHFHAAMVAMRACQDDLIRSWGLNPEELRTLTRPAIPENYEDLAREVQAVYPWRMRSTGWQATIRVRLIVGPDGRPSECNVRADGQREDFTETACDILMKKARFEPALDAAGEPTSALWTTRILYRLR